MAAHSYSRDNRLTKWLKKWNYSRPEKFISSASWACSRLSRKTPMRRQLERMRGKVNNFSHRVDLPLSSSFTTGAPWKQKMKIPQMPHQLHLLASRKQRNLPLPKRQPRWQPRRLLMISLWRISKWSNRMRSPHQANRSNCNSCSYQMRIVNLR